MSEYEIRTCACGCGREFTVREQATKKYFSRVCYFSVRPRPPVISGLKKLDTPRPKWQDTLCFRGDDPCARYDTDCPNSTEQHQADGSCRREARAVSRVFAIDCGRVR